MKIQIASDLHLEFERNNDFLTSNPLTKAGEVLLLAGDIVVGKFAENAVGFYEKVEGEFQSIISAFGNHEFYMGCIDRAYHCCFERLAFNHVRLNNTCRVVGDVKFIVSTLWSYVPQKDGERIEQWINDYSHILTSAGKPIQARDTNTLHAQSVRYILDELRRPFVGKIVVMTHHLPSYECISSKYKSGDLNAAFASSLDSIILAHPEISLWVCGHSHVPVDVTIGSTRIVSNPMGYVHKKEHFQFRRDFVVEV
ncbi:MAG: metallophosphoesterase [Candidatus Aenigmarchaeota archaeon]|nr:metallophosphoesterase [Candidatus Aenigmarchaeota archaeon]